MDATRTDDRTREPWAIRNRRTIVTAFIVGIVTVLGPFSVATDRVSAKVKIKNKDRNANRNDSRSNARVNSLPREQRGSRH